MLLLASSSPRRRELLDAAGFQFDVLAVDLDETPLGGERPNDHVRRLAEQKARTAHQMRPEAIVLGADTVVCVDDTILGKPRDPEDAAEMLRRLSGRAHEVLTGVCVIGNRGEPLVDVGRTRVWFAPLSDAEIRWYTESGEPMDKAGAYAIQGRASRFVTRIDGSYANVVGLPVALVYGLLRRASPEMPEIRRL